MGAGEARVSRPVLREAGGEIPPAYSLHGPGFSQGQDQHWPDLGLRPRRQAVRRARAARGSVLLLTRSRRRTSSSASGQLKRNLPGQCLWRLWEALRTGRQRRSDPGSRLLGPCPTAVLRDGQSDRECAPQGAGQKARGDLAPGAGSSPPDRRLVFEIERGINGQNSERRRAVRQDLSAPLVADLEVLDA